MIALPPLRQALALMLPTCFTVFLPAAPAEVEKLFAPGTPLGESGFVSDWFGTIESVDLPWIKHAELGHVYLDVEHQVLYKPHDGWYLLPQPQNVVIVIGGEAAAAGPAAYRIDSGSWQHYAGSASAGYIYDATLRAFYSPLDPPHPFTIWVTETLWQSEAHIAEVEAALPSVTQYPIHTTGSGAWTLRNSSDWTAGFWPGILWQLYAFTDDPAWEAKARAWNAGMEPNKTRTDTHDLGFMLYCSFGQGYQLTGDTAYRDILVEAAASLDTLHSTTVDAMRSWMWGNWANGNRFTVIADNMMNLELQFWASQQPGGDSDWYQHALDHAHTTQAEHLRADGSSYHVIVFNEDDGSVLERTTHQGYGDNTTWARGQAWLIYGFTLSYRETGDAQTLAAARDTADWFLDNLPSNTPIPFWDFNRTFFREPKDSSAAAIAASALIELSGLETDPLRADRYWDAALELLAALMSPEYFRTGIDALLDHGTYNKPDNNYDHGTVWGDYYFLEALLRYRAAMGY